MKLKGWQEIKGMSQIELETKLRETKEELFRIKFRHASTPLKNPLQIRTLRKLVAKFETLLAENKKQQSKK